MRRRFAREKALQILFQIDVGKTDVEDAIIHVIEQEVDLAEEIGFIRQLVEGTYRHLSDVDAWIRKYSIGWELGRMPNVDRNVLRIATYELLYDREVPRSVVLNEAVELAKTFGTPQSGKFVNGVLGKMLADVGDVQSAVKGTLD